MATPETALQVLIVEDIDAMRLFLEELLSPVPGLQISGTAANGWEAQLAVSRHRPDIVLLDEVLPDGDGSVALSEFHVLSGLPVIIITGTGDDATREACLGSGAVGYLEKPFSISNLLTMIRLFT